MPFYKRIPEIIEAVPFTGNPITGVRIEAKNNSYRVYNLLHDSWIKVKIGDFIRVDKPNDHYPIDKETFQSTYNLLQPCCKGGDA